MTTTVRSVPQRHGWWHLADGAAGTRLGAAAAILVGSLLMGLGTTWDIDWHARVGRDSFWIPPHDVIYGGALLVLLGTAFGLRAERRRGLAAGPGMLRLLGVRAPRGLWVSAVGTIWFFLSAPFDDLWHRLYGIDVTLWSPPHLSLMAAAWVTMLGAAWLLVAERHRLDQQAPRRSRRHRTLERALLLLALAFLLRPAVLAVSPAVRLTYLEPGALGAWFLPGLIAVLLPATCFLAPRALGWRAGLSVAALLHLALVPLGLGVTALGYALTFGGSVPDASPLPGVTPGTVRLASTLVPLLLVPPALAADAALLWLRPGRPAWLLAGLLYGAALALEGIVTPAIIGSRVGAAGWPLALLVLPLLAVPGTLLGQRLGRALTPAA